MVKRYRFKPILVSFCGPDGVGKSTQTAMLISYLQQRGFKVKYCWVRIFHGPAYIVMKIFQKFKRKAPLIRSRLDGVLWFLLEVMGILPKLLIGTTLPLKLGYIIVAERHLLDTIVSLSLFVYKRPDFIMSNKAMFLLRFVPKNSIFILLQASPSTILKRRLKRSLCSDMHLQNPLIRNRVRSRLPLEQSLYRLLIKIIGNGVKINTEKLNIRETYNQVVEIIERFLQHK